MDCLLYVDPSPRGEWALAIMEILPPDFAPSLALLATDEDLAHDPELLLRASTRLGRPARTMRVAPRPGPAEKAILKEVREHPYGLVIVPPAGRNAIQRMLKGSRIATVVRSVGTSVLIAKRPPTRVERVLVAVSGGRTTRSVVGRGLALSRALGATPTFIHIVSEVTLPYAPHGTPASPAREVTPEEHARAVLREVGEEYVLIREGLVVDEVIGEVESGAHHLLVIGTQAGEEQAWGRDDLTERIVLGCPASILVVRSGSLE